MKTLKNLLMICALLAVGVVGAGCADDAALDKAVR